MTYVELIGIGLTGVYSMYILLNVIGLLLLKKSPKDSKNLDFTIIVPYRNENNNLPWLLDSFQKLNYSRDQFEVVLIDDHSEDGSNDLDLTPYDFSVRIIRSNGEGKKAAIQTGIEFSNYPYIAQTDADCEVPADWLKEHSRELSTVNFSGGAVIFSNSSVQTLELYSYLGLGAASARMGSPILANGANMAYRKKDFLDVGGLKENLDVSSGDDVFLLKSFHKAKKKVRISLDAKNVVLTKAEKQFGPFINQRVRWSSKTAKFGDFDTILAGLVVLGINLFVLFQIIHLCFQGALTPVGLIALPTKLLIDFLFLFLVAVRVGGYKPLVYYPLVAPVYSFYIVVVSLLSLFYKPQWKSRKIQI